MATMTALGACDLADGKNSLSVYALDEQNGVSSGFAIILYPTGAAAPTVGGLDNFLGLPFPSNGAAGYSVAVAFFGEPLPLAAPGPFASASTAAQAFGASLVAQIQSVSGFTGCLILWAGSLGALPTGLPMLRFTASLDGFVDSLALTTTTPALLAPGTDGTGLTLSSVGDPVQLSATGSGFLMSGGQLVIATGSGNNGSLFLTSEITLAVDATAGQAMGSLSMAVTSQSGFGQTAAGFTYAVQPQPTAGTPPPANGGTLYSYPLFDASVDFTHTSIAGTLVLAPSAASGGSTGRLVFGTGAPALASTFRTALLTPVTLTADGSTGGLSLGGAPDGSLRWTPAGTFALGLSGGTDVMPAALLCGLSGVETAALTATAQVTFVPGSPATVWQSAAPAATGTPGYGIWTGNGSPPCTTAWLTLTDSATGAGLAWDAQSAAAPLFVGTSTPSVLGPARLATGQFPGAGTPVPMVPYAGIATAPAGSDLPGFESGFLAVRRAAIIAAASAATPTLQNGASMAVTPQGVVAGFNTATGAMTSLTFAAQQGPGTAVSVGFQAAGNGALPAALADAFLTPQPFVVMTCLSAAVAASAPLTATMSLDGWAFTIPLPNNGQISGGTFGTVMLFKAAGAPLSQLVTTPGAWSGYAIFNDTAFDPTGGLLAAHLSRYVASVRAKWNGGKGPAAYGPLIDILDDPAWSGLLVLKPQVDIGNCAPSLEPILIGTGDAALYADHIGVSVTQLSRANTATGAAEQFAQNSAMFGFIDYAASSTLPAVGPAPQPAAGSNVAATLVTTSLQATFVNSTMTAFASAGALAIESLFDDAAGQPGSSIPLAGSAHSVGGTTTYALAPPPGSVTSIPLVSAGISTVVVGGVTTTMPTATSMVFSLSGWLTTPMAPAGALDLLSYGTVAFSGYPITMDWSASPVTFGANPAAVQLGALPGAALPAAGLPLAAAYGSNYYRAGSLAASMPVGAQGVLVQPSGSPASLGYQRVTVTPSAGTAPDYTKPWLGLVLDLDLGGSGALAGNAVLSADFLLAWAPVSSGGDGRSLDLWVRFIGPAGMPLGLTIEGVVTIGATSATLSQQSGTYVLRLGEIGLTILSKTFPTAGSVDLYLAGFAGTGGTPTLGWFGGYARAAS
ncbi:hypothetical protein J2848_003360 [Azospirillum lipoferum]|uniref:Uncharacterized protein n=1 Tax=Azospirillum lipoferum TaxID=193 RepID=A0A5A9GNL1_AZOLI|nr:MULTISPECIES: hypothetical protein [Azospirillum]KAA0595415.1 hypothetical protein FZ942_17505 [Azospirillum lipoferum]MCP1611682.1 hypothetical protein [Azospirillum lipoferum]MDW5533559.1 hypothetical protein [Azospirillum sp. NL1]